MGAVRTSTEFNRRSPRPLASAISTQKVGELWRDLPPNAELRSTSDTQLVNAKYPYLAKPTNQKARMGREIENGYFISPFSRVSEIFENLFKNRMLKNSLRTTIFNSKNLTYRIILYRSIQAEFIRAKTRFCYLYVFWGIWADGRVAISLAKLRFPLY